MGLNVLVLLFYVFCVGCLGQTTDPVLLYSDLPPVRSIIPPHFHPVIALQLLGVEYKNLTAGTHWCTEDAKFFDWCGGNASAPYDTCFYMPQWPLDYYSLRDWLNETVFTQSTAEWPYIPVFCTCPHTGRAVYVPENPQLGFSYGEECYTEHGLLAVTIVLIVFHFFLLLFALVELYMWTAIYIAGTHKYGHLSTFLPKLFSAMYCMFAIVTLTVNVQTSNYGGNYPILFTFIWFWVFTLVWTTLAFLYWLYVFNHMTATIKEVTKPDRSTNPLGVWKYLCWFVLVIVQLDMLGLIGMVAATHAKANQLIAEPSFIVKQGYYSQYVTYYRVCFILAACGLGADCVWGTILVGKSFHDLMTSNRNTNSDRMILEKCLLNLFTVCCYYIALVALIIFGVGIYFYRFNWSDYTLIVAQGWLIFIMFFCAGLAVFSLLMAVRTVFQEGGGYCSTIKREQNTIKKSVSSRASARSKSSGKLTAGSAKDSGSSTLGSTREAVRD